MTRAPTQPIAVFEVPSGGDKVVTCYERYLNGFSARRAGLLTVFGIDRLSATALKRCTNNLDRDEARPGTPG